jgi:hypothetical protein
MAITAPEDPSLEVQRSRTKMEVESAKPPMDDKELAERNEATDAYLGEDEAHFVAYVNDCVKMSRDSMTDIRKEQAECWDVFNEKEPINYSFKEPWQSRTVLPKPNIYVMAFLATISKAFDPQFLSIENEQDKIAAEDIRKIMSLMMSKSFSSFAINFIDATQMGAAVGQSMEMIPMWSSGIGPYWDLIEPWKIHRDPDSHSRQPQSGLYWIHQEWLDFHDLRKMEKKGLLQNLQDCGPGGQWGNPSSDANIEPNELKRRRDMLYQQSAYRTKVLTSEFYGTVLDRRGEELSPKYTYWVVADRVVKRPKAPPYPTLKWPGTSFSPLPHLLRHDGRSLLTGLKSLWYAMCNLFALHIDNLNWTVNPQKEIDISSLVDQEDLDDYPGKTYLVRGTQQGNMAIRTVDRKSTTGDILANLKFGDQVFQNGGPVTYAQQGLPDYRAEVTARESAQNLNQSNTVMSLVAGNLDDGGLSAIEALWETVRINITYKELAAWMGPEMADKYRDNSITGLRLPSLTSGSFKISGATTLIQNQEVINTIGKLILPLCEPNGMGKVFLPYMKPFKVAKAIEKRANLEDEGLFVDEEKANQIDEAQQAQQDAQIQAQKEQEAAQVAGAEAEANKHGALADKAGAEAMANQEQAGLFQAQAGAVEAQPPAGPEMGV